MTADSILARMDAAIDRLQRQWQGRRHPKAFYLSAEDWVAFEATGPERGRFAFGNNPTVWRDEPKFRGFPVRPTKSPSSPSRLYDDSTVGRRIP